MVKEKLSLRDEVVEDWPILNRAIFYALIALDVHTWPGLFSGTALGSPSVQRALEAAYESAVKFPKLTLRERE